MATQGVHYSYCLFQSDRLIGIVRFPEMAGIGTGIGLGVVGSY